MPAHDGPHDLGEFYAGNRRGFWFLLVLVSTTSRIVHYIGVGLLFVLVLLHYGRATIN